RMLHEPSHTSVMCSSLSPRIASWNALYSRAARFRSCPFGLATSVLMGPPRSPVVETIERGAIDRLPGSRVNPLVEEELPVSLRTVVDVARRRESEGRVHLDRHRVRLLGRRVEARARRHVLDRAIERARDAAPAVVLLHTHERDERALEPV